MWQAEWLIFISTKLHWFPAQDGCVRTVLTQAFVWNSFVKYFFHIYGHVYSIETAHMSP